MKKNIGFGAIGTVLVAAAVALVGLIGWRLYDANKNKQSNSSNQTSNTQQSNTQTQGNASTGSQADSATYLDIKELGVKIKLDDKTKGVTYAITQSSGDEGVYIIDPAMKSIDDGNQYCSGATAGMIGLLDRSKDVNHWGEPLTVDNAKSFKIGDYYYLFRGPQSECSQDSSISQQRASHEQDFLNVLKTMQLDK